MATEARPAFLPITGRVEYETREAAQRFSACLIEVAGELPSRSAVAAAALASRAFGGDQAAWAPLVAAVRRLLLTGSPPDSPRGQQARRELRAFVAENADLLE